MREYTFTPEGITYEYNDESGIVEVNVKARGNTSITSVPIEMTVKETKPSEPEFKYLTKAQYEDLDGISKGILLFFMNWMGLKRPYVEDEYDPEELLANATLYKMYKATSEQIIKKFRDKYENSES